MRKPSERLEEKHAVNPPSWCSNYRYFLHRQEQGGQIARSSFEVVLQTTKHTIIYSGISPSLEVIVLRLVV
jgi:hypothetical protein